MREQAKIILQLIKYKITLLATISTATGYLISSGKLEKDLFIACLGIFMLAGGSCALNQYQDRRIDSLMERTKDRPIPSGKISPVFALIISGGFLLIGSIMLLIGNNLKAFLLGIFAAFWYNAIYTYLKRKTIFSVLVGAIIGAIPPMVGYAAASNTFFNYKIMGLSLFLFLWQVPHFWLLSLKFNDDYERAGLPTLRKKFQETQINKITFLWILATAMSSLLIPLFIEIKYYVSIIIFISMLWLIRENIKFYLRPSKRIQYLALFKEINIFALIIMILISVGVLQ